jgi:hypothetical protein
MEKGRRQLVQRRASKTRLRRIIGGGVIAGLIIGLLAILTWAQRTAWHTLILMPDPKHGIGVSIDYPDDWKIAGRRDKSAPVGLSLRVGWAQEVRFYPQEPNSLLKWCQEHLWGKRQARPLPTTIQFSLWPDTPDAISAREAFFTQHTPASISLFNQVKVTRLQAPAGSALDVTSTLQLPGSGGTGQRWRSHQIFLSLVSQQRPSGIALHLTCSMPENDTTGLEGRLQEVVRRIRVTNVPADGPGEGHHDSSH